MAAKIVDEIGGSKWSRVLPGPLELSGGDSLIPHIMYHIRAPVSISREVK